MLKNQIAKSNNGIVRSKYITFGLPADRIAEAKRVATALELYCTGSLNLFNHHTNVQNNVANGLTKSENNVTVTVIQ